MNNRLRRWLGYAAAALIVAAWLSGLFVIHAVAAPAPRFRAKPPAEPAAGEWLLTWGETTVPWTLKADGTFRQDWMGTPYRGSWHWDTKTRTLRVHETKDGYNWHDWSVVLGGDGVFNLAGRATYNAPWAIPVDCSLRRKPK